MKDKILAAFKAKYPTVNLSKARLNAIAAKIETKVIDDETKIDAALDELNNSSILSFADIAKEDDRVRNLEAKNKPATPPKEDPKDPPADPPPADDTPSWAKKLMEEVSILRGEKAKNEIRSKITEKLKEVPEKFWIKRSLPEKEEDIETFVTDVNTDFTDFHQGLVDIGLAIKPPKSGSAGAAGGKETASKEELDSLAKQIL